MDETEALQKKIDELETENAVMYAAIDVFGNEVENSIRLEQP